MCFAHLARWAALYVRMSLSNALFVIFVVFLLNDDAINKLIVCLILSEFIIEF